MTPTQSEPLAEAAVAEAPRQRNIDPAIILDRFEGDRGLLREVVKLFLEDGPRHVSAIRQAIGRRDSEGVQRAAHSIRGSVGNFAADAAVGAALKLEMMGRGGDLAHADEACAALEEEMALLTAALARFI
jgi:two-component system sensor histidine kinase/response regulator